MSEAIPEAFRNFFDDAAVFPPGLATLPNAVADHLRRRRTPLGAATGPLVLALDDLEAANTEVQRAARFGSLDTKISVSVVTPAGRLVEVLRRCTDATRLPGVAVTAIELKVDPERSRRHDEIADAAERSPVPVFVELSVDQFDDGSMELISDGGLRVKYRCGGLDAASFPSTSTVALVLRRAAESSVPMKFTAGLHQAVRHLDHRTGFTHHGFVNIANAAAAALDGEAESAIEELLAEEDSPSVVWQFRQIGPSWRKLFVSFGTCSVAEPAQGLAALGLFPSNVARADLAAPATSAAKKLGTSR
jgi:hypothetical protein